MIDITLQPSEPFLKGETGPPPAIRIKTYSRARAEASAAGAPPIEEHLLDIPPRITFAGVRLEWIEIDNGPRFGSSAREMANREILWVVRPSREEIEAINSVRSGDVRVDLSVELRFLTSEQMPFGPYESVFTSCQDKVSERDWLGILDQLGYYGGWVVEVPRPTIEGMEDVVKFLDSAWIKFQAHDPPGAVADLRKAWDRADPIIDAFAADRDRSIDGLSRGEANQPSKSLRIAGVRQTIDKFTQIGPHSDVYEVTSDDALLAYRLTASMIAYLSKKARRVV
jgi:hypothetical protein